MTDNRLMLFSGTLFDLTDPHSSELSLNDIAHGLGRVCRFAGQSNRFYSVAEHCVNVARLVPIELGRAALLHDGSEALIGDVTRPLKALLPDYRLIEARLEDMIASRFASPGAPPLPLHDPLIKAADRAMCAVEARELMPAAPGYWEGIGADPEDLKRASRLRLTFDKPEFATFAWLRAWQWFGHAEEEARQRASAPAADPAVHGLCAA